MRANVILYVFLFVWFLGINFKSYCFLFQKQAIETTFTEKIQKFKRKTLNQIINDNVTSKRFQIKLSYNRLVFNFSSFISLIRFFFLCRKLFLIIINLLFFKYSTWWTAPRTNTVLWLNCLILVLTVKITIFWTSQLHLFNSESGHWLMYNISNNHIQLAYFLKIWNF